MIWIIVIGVIIFILYSFFKDRDQMLQRQVDLQGGMLKKYEYLVSRLTNDPASKVIKVTRDHIHIRATTQSTVADYFISENFNSVVIEWICQLGMLGTHKKQWSFPHNYPQETMIAEIENFMVWKTNQMFGL